MVSEIIVFIVIVLATLLVLAFCIQLHRYFTRVAPRYDAEVLDTVLQVIGTKPIPQPNECQIFVFNVNPPDDQNTAQTKVSTNDCLKENHHESSELYRVPSYNR